MSLVRPLLRLNQQGTVPAVEQCIASAVHRWEFPKPQGQVAVVIYPFVLKSSGE